MTRTATLAGGRGEPALDSVLLAVAMRTPFSFQKEYATNYAHRGSIHRRTYQIDRGGFRGPLRVRMAERQVRHLQGLRGGEHDIAADADAFTYAVTLPPWMELTRTARCALMVFGTVEDHDGSEHVVSYSSGTQNDQFVMIVAPGVLSVEAEPASVLAVPGKTAEVRVRIKRSATLAPVETRVELVLPRHMHGVVAEPLILAPGEDEAKLAIRIADETGPLNMPAIVRATTLEPDSPYFAEMTLELIEPEF